MLPSRAGHQIDHALKLRSSLTRAQRQGVGEGESGRFVEAGKGLEVGKLGMYLFVCTVLVVGSGRSAPYPLGKVDTQNRTSPLDVP